MTESERIPPLPFADLHAHYPMRVTGKERFQSSDAFHRARKMPSPTARFKAFILWVASRLASDTDSHSGYRITPDTLEAGRVCMAWSVITRADDEVDASMPFEGNPRNSYFEHLTEDLDAVEEDVEAHPSRPITVATTHGQLEQLFPDGEEPAARTVLVHAIEGGFSLGGDEVAIRENVKTLADRGVVYVTLAHLFFRQVATNAPALPFMPEVVYGNLFPQPAVVTDPDEPSGLTDLGREAVRAMAERRVMVDISHMREDAIEETFKVLDQVDEPKTVPVVATHAGYRFGKQKYMLSRDTIERIAERKGLIGLIMSQHQLEDGWEDERIDEFLEDGARDLPPGRERSLAVIAAHIRAIHDVTKSYDNIALGTDFDGFIKPTVSGFETPADLVNLSAKLLEVSGSKEEAEKVAYGNAVRVLKRLWANRSEVSGGRQPQAARH